MQIAIHRLRTYLRPPFGHGAFDHIAALSGHGTTKTATEHYCRATAGRKKMSAILDYEINVETLPRPGGGEQGKMKINDNLRSYKSRSYDSQGPKL